MGTALARRRKRVIKSISQSRYPSRPVSVLQNNSQQNPAQRLTVQNRPDTGISDILRQPSMPITRVAGIGRVQLKDLKRCNDPNYAQGSDYLHATMVAGEKGMMDMVKRLVRQGTLVRKWRLNWYTKQMLKLNFSGNKNYMHVGNCYVFSKTLKDPNVGVLPSLKTANTTMARAEKTSLLNVVVATIYAEQTQDLPKQHEYIWYSMKKRVGSYEKSSKLYSVLKEYNAFNDVSSRTHFVYAVMHLNGKSLARLTRQGKFKPAVVDKIKKMVKSDWATRLPPKAGMFYFHWNENAIPDLVTLWDHYGNYKKQPMLREQKCALDFGTKKFGNVSLTQILRGTVPTQTQRPVGSMYVFKLK